MYFIHRGTVEVVSEHDEPIIFDTMGEGRFFGEISVVFSCPRTASIRLEQMDLKVEVNYLRICLVNAPSYSKQRIDLFFTRSSKSMIYSTLRYQKPTWRP